MSRNPGKIPFVFFMSGLARGLMVPEYDQAHKLSKLKFKERENASFSGLFSGLNFAKIFIQLYKSF